MTTEEDEMTQTPQLQSATTCAATAPAHRHRLRGSALAAVSVGLLVAAIYFASAAGPAAPAKASSAPVDVLFFIEHLPAGHAVSLTFDQADSTIDHGILNLDRFGTGGVSFFSWTSDQVAMSAQTDPPSLLELTATFALVRGGPITGTAVVPAGARVTALAFDGKPMVLDGKFSIPTSGPVTSTR
jgi:hypothetical protein